LASTRRMEKKPPTRSHRYERKVKYSVEGGGTGRADPYADPQPEEEGERKRGGKKHLLLRIQSQAGKKKGGKKKALLRRSYLTQKKKVSVEKGLDPSVCAGGRGCQGRRA